MRDRSDALAQFLADAGRNPSNVKTIAGDASNRSYLRIHDDVGTAIVMDADPAKGEDVRPFVRIAKYLLEVGLSAPHIYAQDEANGFLLIEDFGDDLFARLLADGQADEYELYSAATDVLVHLRSAPAPTDLARYDTALMSELATLAVDWYRWGLTRQKDESLKSDFQNMMEKTFSAIPSAPLVLTQRDYHAENLIWLPDRSGVARVGLLDFQDAMLCHPLYDLVSVLQDARRDVSGNVEKAMLESYFNQTGDDPDTGRDAYARLGLQRNLRIVGVFARLWLRDGKPGYLRLIPRVWAHVETNLDHIGDQNLAQFVRQSLPAPTAEVLESLRASA